jgi:hypothetical protein
MSAPGPGCVKTPTSNLRAESLSRLRSIRKEAICQSPSEEEKRENNSARSLRVHVFTPPGSKGEILIPTKCSPLFPISDIRGANSATKPLPPTPDFLIVSSGD